jgi:NAD(P)-dependent dehydrogenase (short-subunit alcohol dehydrogenase family)
MTNPFDLSGKTILVTGATAGLGRQSAVTASFMGARVIITGRNEEKLERTFKTLHGEGHTALVADFAEAVNRDAFADELPALDGIAHCAGATLLQPLQFITEKRFREIYTINVEAPLFLTQRILKKRKLNKGGSLAFISSIAAFRGALGHSIYAGSKAALVGIVRVLAHELAGLKIRANCISPGMVKTEVAEGLAQQLSPEAVAADEATYPLGYGTPEDVANAVVYFLSPASRWVTGTNFIMDGGLT